MRKGEWLRWLASAALLLGCGDQQAPQAEQTGAPEPNDRLGEALSQGCGNGPPMASGQDWFRYTSPTSYSPPNCFKGAVVDWRDTGTNNGMGGAPPNSVTITWAAAVPTSQSACESAWLGGYQFADDGQGNWVAVDVTTATGTWSGSDCATPRVIFSGISPSARIAMSARTAPSTSAPTQALNMVFAPPVH